MLAVQLTVKSRSSMRTFAKTSSWKILMDTGMDRRKTKIKNLTFKKMSDFENLDGCRRWSLKVRRSEKIGSGIFGLIGWRWVQKNLAVGKKWSYFMPSSHWDRPIVIEREFLTSVRCLLLSHQIQQLLRECRDILSWNSFLNYCCENQRFMI